MQGTFRKLIAAVPLVALAACSDGESSLAELATGGGSDAGGSTSFPADSPRKASGELGCSWLLVSDPDLANIAFPDEYATYWVGSFPALPGTRLRVEGQYPLARYFSFNVYDPALRPVDAITDYQLLPRVGGTNPYRDAGAAPGGDYVAYIVPEPAPDVRADNTVYSGSIALPGGQVLPANPTITVIYRIYLPEVDGSGGVMLPKLVLETADGAQAPVSFSMSQCQPLPPEGAPGLLNDAIREASLPPEAGVVPFPIARDPPRVIRFYGLPETSRVLLSNAAGREIPIEQLTAGDTGGGFLSNRDNAYVTTMASRDKGSLYIVRAKAPRAALLPAEAPLGSAQLRYWSLCTNEFFTQRFAGCLHDTQVPLDRNGYFTVVVSDPDQRPLNAVESNGIAWLPWGAPYYDSVFIYRHMLPSPHFVEAVQNIPYGTPPQDVMAEYFPAVTYCDRATVEAAGEDAASVFSACAQHAE